MNILKRISFKDANGVTVTGTVSSAYNAGTVLFPDWCVEFTRDTAIKGYHNYCNLSQVRDKVTEVKLWREVWVTLYAFRPIEQGEGSGGLDWFWAKKSFEELAQANCDFYMKEFPEDEFTYFSVKAELPIDDKENIIDELDTYTDRFVHGYDDHKLHWFRSEDAKHI